VALTAARAVDAGAVAQAFVNDPAKIKDAVHRARAKAVAQALGDEKPAE
jgi:tRNA nucleotidyltransferase (CCA-adding enzyme)